MDFTWSSLDWSIIIVITLSLSVLLLPVASIFRRRTGQLPPEPAGWPVFGHMFKLGSEPHKTIAALRERYGSVVWLRIGSINTMAILAAKPAAELFKNHDLSLADRNVVHSMCSHDYHKSSLAIAPYGTYWRMLRRLCTTEMFVQKKIDETETIRRKCVDDLLSWLSQEASSGDAVEVTRFVFLASFNMVGKMMLSRDLLDPNSTKASEFFAALMGITEWVGRPNLSDAFGFLKWLDLQGLRRNNDTDMGKALEIASGFVKERMNEMKQEKKKVRKDFLDVLLQFRGNGKDEPEKLSDHNINVFILEIFLAGSETTSSTIEWALTELLRHPEEMAKTKEEIDKIVGPDKKFEESDVEHLPYLQAVVKETLRLHPPLPFLLPRKATRDTEFIGYKIPKNTQVFVNAWAIGRDPECWDDPMSFKPERFLGSKIDYKGQNFELLPFGGGRRICVGLPLGHRMLHLVLGSLLHKFDFELDESSITNGTLDVKEKIGMVARKLEPLKVILKKRNI